MVVIYHERKLHQDAATNSRISLLNVSLLGLQRNPHHILENIYSTNVKKLWIHIKMLCQDKMTQGTLAKQSADRGSICQGEWDDVLTECLVFQPTRDVLLPQIAGCLADAVPSYTYRLGHGSPYAMTRKT